MKPQLLLASFLLLSTLSVAQPLPQEVPGGYQGAAVGDYAALNGNLVFMADNELWLTDGTSAGTQLLKSFNSGSAIPMRAFKEWNGKVYFIADDGIHGIELWVTDGTSPGTMLVKDINATGDALEYIAQSQQTTLQVLNNKIYFIANDGIHGREIWASDGTGPGTHLFADLYHGGFNGAGKQRTILSVANRLYFHGTTGFSTGLFVTDGTTQGTMCLVDTMYEVQNLIPYGNKVLFSADNTIQKKVYISNGTLSGTFPLINDQINTQDYAELNGKLYFFTKDDNSAVISFMETDGTSLGTNVVSHPLTARDGNSSQNLFSLSAINNKLVFCAGIDTNRGRELIVSDGTAQGTMVLSDLVPGAFSSTPINIVTLGNELYFQAWDSSRLNLWHTDGTTSGTNMIAVPIANSYFSNHIINIRTSVLRPLVPVGNSLYFYAKYDNTLGFRLYKLDVFPAGVNQEHQLTSIDIYPNPSQGVINIDADNATNISIYSMTGSCVYNQAITDVGAIHKADIHQLSAGTYTIATLLKDGTQRHGKFVKR